MRVITGKARGRKLKTLEGEEIVRPTSDKVKEAMFSIVQFELDDAVVLDAFAGSGQLGIEALSRGAAKAYFIDENKAAFETVKENLKLTKLFDGAVVLHTDAFTFFTNTREKFDIIFLDPPYRKELVATALPAVARCCNQDALVVCETDIHEELPECVGSLHKLREYKYSKTKLTTYRNQEESL